MVVTLLVAFAGNLSATGNSIITAVTTVTRAGAVAPGLAMSVVVDTVKPVGDAVLALPVVSSPAAKVILCAPAAKSAVPVVQTILRVAAVKVQVPFTVAVPAAGTRTPAGVAFPLK